MRDIRVALLTCYFVTAIAIRAQCVQSAPQTGCPQFAPEINCVGCEPQQPMNVDAQINVQLNGAFVSIPGVVDQITNALTTFTSLPNSNQTFQITVQSTAAPATNDPDQLAANNSSNYSHPVILITSDVTPSCAGQLTPVIACTITSQAPNNNQPVASVISLTSLTDPNTGVPYEFEPGDYPEIMATEMAHIILALTDCDPSQNASCINSASDTDYGSNHPTGTTYCDEQWVMSQTNNTYGYSSSGQACLDGTVCLPGNVCSCQTSDNCGGGLVCLGNACGCGTPCDDPSCPGYTCEACGTNCEQGCTSDSDCAAGLVCMGGTCGCSTPCDDTSCSGYSCDSCGTDCNGTCQTDNDCPGGLVCIGGTCGCSNSCDDSSCSGYDPCTCVGTCASSSCPGYAPCTCE